MQRDGGDQRRDQAAAAVDSGILPVGFRLERYRVIKHIAAGGFGITYLAEHEGLKRQYAIKEHFPREFAFRDGSSVRPNTADKNIFGWALKRFAEEAEKLAKFKHPAIVDVVDVFEANGTAYMVMGFEPGQTMGKWLEGLGRLPTQAELDRIAGPLLDALEVMHAAHFLHRDIAPDNIIVRPDGSPCLIDFGAARQAMGQQTKTLTAIVKAGYSPVEQYDTEGDVGQGPWTDIYAFAATCYRALTGAKPPEAPGRVVSDRLTPVAGRGANGYRPAFLAAIDAALRVAPQARPQSVSTWRPMLMGGATAAPQGGTTQRWEAPAVLPQPFATAPVQTNSPPPRSAPVPAFVPSQVPVSEHRRRSGVLTGAIVIGLGAAILGGVWLLTRPTVNQMADAEFAKIERATDIQVFEDFQRRYPGTQAAKKAETRATDLRRERASSSREQGRQARHKAAADEWDRIKETTDEQVVERFIAAHGDAPVVAEARTRLASLKQQRAQAARNATAAAEWERLKASEDEAAIERFLSTYGDTQSATAARTRLADIRRENTARVEAERQQQARITAAANEWTRIKDTSDEVLIERFIRAHPETPAAEEAKVRLASLVEERRRRQGPHALSAAEERALKPKDEFQECAQCPRMVVIPAGRFLMGSPPDEKDRLTSDEGPVHEVTIRLPFAVGKFEVTFAEWDACVADGGCQSNRSPNDQGWGRGTRPVINVSWNDAKEYVAWLARTTGKGYRLLSEAEWEYAARAQSRTRFHFGDSESELGQYAWFTQNSSSRTHLVGQKQDNAFGLFDMHGNVSEWVEDCWHDTYNGAPIDGSTWNTSCTDSTGRVLRGGSWNYGPRFLRSALRFWYPTGIRNPTLGFRLGRTLGVLAERTETSPPTPPPQKQASVTPPATAAPPSPSTKRVLSAAEEGALKPKDEFQECDVCPRMVVVPAGRFNMGSAADEIAALKKEFSTVAQLFDSEVPVHEVTIARPFAVARTHVTRGEYAAFVKETGYQTGDKCWTLEDGKSEQRTGRSFRNPGFEQNDQHPVVCVSWDDAKAYAEWLSRKTGRTYRLLSEAETEYAMRGVTTTTAPHARFWFGNDEKGLCQNANGADLTAKEKVPGASNWAVPPCRDGFAYTAPVANFRPNTFGLFDVSGNVWTWTEDCWHDNYRGVPTNGAAWTVACTNGTHRVLRGGSWGNVPWLLRSAFRSGDHLSSRKNWFGLRVTRTLQ